MVTAVNTNKGKSHRHILLKSTHYVAQNFYNFSPEINLEIFFKHAL